MKRSHVFISISRFIQDWLVTVSLTVAASEMFLSQRNRSQRSSDCRIIVDFPRKFSETNLENTTLRPFVFSNFTLKHQQQLNIGHLAFQECYKLLLRKKGFSNKNNSLNLRTLNNRSFSKISSGLRRSNCPACSVHVGHCMALGIKYLSCEVKVHSSSIEFALKVQMFLLQATIHTLFNISSRKKSWKIHKISQQIAQKLPWKELPTIDFPWGCNPHHAGDAASANRTWGLELHDLNFAKKKVGKFSSVRKVSVWFLYL